MPVGSVIDWHKSVLFGVENLPVGWEECNGQQKTVNGRTYTLPNLNSGGTNGVGLFTRGGTTSGVIQQSQNLTHAQEATPATPSRECEARAASQRSMCRCIINRRHRWMSIVCRLRGAAMASMPLLWQRATCTRLPRTAVRRQDRRI